MKSIVVVGAQWGDEGKGKVVDYLSATFDYIARCAGGHNAGHTVIIGDTKFVLQLIPCGILRPGKKAVIGAGVVVDPAALVAEIDMLAPTVAEIATQYAGKLKVVKLNVDENQIATSFNIRGIPTLLIFKGGQVADQLVGAVPKDKIESILARHLS